MIEQTFQRIETADECLNAIAEVSHLDRAQSHRGLRTVLRLLNESLPLEQSAHLAGRLPLLLRGPFYEGTQSHRTQRPPTRREFLSAVKKDLASRQIVDPSDVTEKILVVIGRMLLPDEARRIRRSLPPDLQSLWQEHD